MKKVGRNDPCPCGSGSKYKKCCLAENEAERRAQSTSASRPQPATAAPRDPLEDARLERQEEFGRSGYERRIEIYRETLGVEGLMDGEMAFDMLSRLHDDALGKGDHVRFEGLSVELESRLPEVYAEESSYILAWRITQALAANDDALLIRLVQAYARAETEEPARLLNELDKLAFHGRSDVLAAFASALIDAGTVEGDVAQAVEDVTIATQLDAYGPDGADMCHRALARAEGCDHCVAREQRVQRFAGLLREEASIAELADEEKRERLVDALVFDLHRLERVPYIRAVLLGDTLIDYLSYRADQGGARKVRRHPVWPDRGSLQSFIATMLGDLFFPEIYRAAVLIDLLPAVLRCLEARRLLGGMSQRRALEDIEPVVRWLRTFVERRCSDPALERALAEWPRAKEIDAVPLPRVRDPERARQLLEAFSASSRDRANEEDEVDFDEDGPYIDQRAGSELPSQDIFEGADLGDPDELAEAVDAFAYDLASGWYLSWEGVIREEQGLPLSRAHQRQLDQLVSFSDVTPGRMLYINGVARPSEPWWASARRLAAALAQVELDAVHPPPDNLRESWERMRAAIDEHARELSRPSGATAPLDVIPPELRFRLEVRAALDPLLGLGQSWDGQIVSIADEGERWRIEALVENLREVEDAVSALELSVDGLLGMLSMPETERTACMHFLTQALDRASREAPIAGPLGARLLQSARGGRSSDSNAPRPEIGTAEALGRAPGAS